MSTAKIIEFKALDKNAPAHADVFVEYVERTEGVTMSPCLLRFTTEQHGGLYCYVNGTPAQVVALKKRWNRFCAKPPPGILDNLEWPKCIIDGFVATLNGESA